VISAGVGRRETLAVLGFWIFLLFAANFLVKKFFSWFQCRWNEISPLLAAWKNYFANPLRKAHAWDTLDMSMGHTWPVNKKWGCMHCIMFTWYPMYNSSLLTASPLFSHSNYPLSLHGKRNLMITKYSMKPMQYADLHALPYKYNVPLSTKQT